MGSPIYLDCCATTPLEESVKDVLLHYLTVDYGNEGSRTHEYGSRAKQAVQKARDQVGAVVDAKRDEVIFTSGATESNNLAILGLAKEGIRKGKKHIISTGIEHKAVIEPIDYLKNQGFEISWIQPEKSGRIQPSQIESSLRKDTLLVSVMHANNETGILQPVEGIAQLLGNHDAYFHCDAAQGYGKDLSSLQHPRIDLISISGHKIFAPKGIGALVARRRGFRRCPLSPITVGGGQERGLRPGTLPVSLIAALGQAAETAEKEYQKRKDRCLSIRKAALDALGPLNIQITGDQKYCMPHVLNFSVNSIDSEALIVSLKDLVAISNGSACTSTSYSASHVLKAMGMTDDQANACVRFSWCHLTPDFDWNKIIVRMKDLM
jgi:cysteine desulfurase